MGFGTLRQAMLSMPASANLSWLPVAWGIFLVDGGRCAPFPPGLRDTVGCDNDSDIIKVTVSLVFPQRLHGWDMVRSAHPWFDRSPILRRTSSGFMNPVLSPFITFLPCCTCQTGLRRKPEMHQSSQGHAGVTPWICLEVWLLLPLQGTSCLLDSVCCKKRNLETWEKHCRISFNPTRDFAQPAIHDGPVNGPHH